MRSELAEQLQKYQGRVVLRGDNVKDDTGGFAVVTEQDASPSHMTAAHSSGYDLTSARNGGKSE